MRTRIRAGFIIMLVAMLVLSGLMLGASPVARELRRSMMRDERRSGPSRLFHSGSWFTAISQG